MSSRQLKVLLSIFLSFWLLSCNVSEQADKDFVWSYPLNEQSLTVEFRAVGKNTIEVLYYNSETNPFPSYAKATDQSFPLEIDTQNEWVHLTRGDLKASFDIKTSEVSFYRGQELLTKQFAVGSDTEVKFEFSLAKEEKLLGGGERVLGMDRRGHSLPLYNRAHYGYETESFQMNYSLPAIMSSNKYFLLFDNTAKGNLDLGKSDLDKLSFDAVGGRAAYIIGTDTSYPNLINNYVQVTGKPKMLPRWSLGHFISRFGYRTGQEVREVVNLTQKENIPADAVIIDLYWFGQDIKGHLGNLDWDKNNFPEPQKLIDDISAQGIKPILITEPFILSTSNRWEQATQAGALALNDKDEPYRFEFYFGNTGLVDVFNDQGRSWFAEQYKRIFKQNVAGTWGDLGEPEVHPDDIRHYLSDSNQEVRGEVIHNAYGHEWAKLVYNTEKELFPERRPFILMRAGFAGSQRYGIVPWTGDVNRTWGGLKPQVEISLQMGLFGLGYMHSDLGGFAGGEQFNKELYIRWLQYGVFQPIYRPHAQDHIASEPAFQEQQTKSISRDFIKLRYRLTPYLYSLIHQHSQTGLPLMRPIFFSDESNAELIEQKDSYFWGDAFLVKPITEPGLSEVAVDLPSGTWFNYWSDEIYPGEQTITFPVTLETIPVLVRAGSFIPMVNDFNNFSEYNSKELTIDYYHHDSVLKASGEMFEDDGESSSSIDNNAYEILKFNAQQTTKGLVFNLKRDAGVYPNMPQTRTMNLRVRNCAELPKQVVMNGSALAPSAYSYDATKRLLTILINWDHTDTQLEVQH